MRRILCGAIAATVLLTTAFGSVTLEAQRSRDRDDDHRAKVAAAIIAATAMGVAVAAARNRDDDDDDRYRSRDRYQYRDYQRFDDRPSQWYPRTGVTCYQKLRQCYEVGHGYSARWTRREFY